MKAEVIDSQNIQLIAENVEEQAMLNEWSKLSKTIRHGNAILSDGKVSEMTIQFIDIEEQIAS